LILRDKRENTEDNGVWLATTERHHEGLRREFPNTRSIHVLGKAVTGWQVIPAGAADFEEVALRGDVPQERRERSREVVHSPLVAKETFIGLKDHVNHEGRYQRHER
jgi:hypothetical protein